MYPHQTVSFIFGIFFGFLTGLYLGLSWAVHQLEKATGRKLKSITDICGTLIPPYKKGGYKNVPN